MKKTNRKVMIKEVSNLEEFEDCDVNSYTDTELGAILGYWDIGDGGVRN